VVDTAKWVILPWEVKGKDFWGNSRKRLQLAMEKCLPFITVQNLASLLTLCFANLCFCTKLIQKKKWLNRHAHFATSRRKKVDTSLGGFALDTLAQSKAALEN